MVKAVEQEPEVALAHWFLVEEDPSRRPYTEAEPSPRYRVVGLTAEGEQRVSSPIASIDVEKREVVTVSGRLYRLASEDDVNLGPLPGLWREVRGQVGPARVAWSLQSLKQVIDGGIAAASEVTNDEGDLVSRMDF